MKNLYIVVVSFNGGDTLIKLINDLILEKEKERKIDIEIVVVDNGSEKKLEIRNPKSEIKLIENKKNLGFAAGCNIGVKYALSRGADRILLINQDVIIKPGFIRVLMDNKADIVAPVIKFRRGKDWIYDFGGKVNWELGRTYHIEKIATPGRWPNGLLPGGSEDVDYVSGCCMMVKREVFGKVGLFDENFFMYFEDVDFCVRARKMNFELAVEPRAIIVHNLLAGIQKPFSNQMQVLKSNFIFIDKYLGFRRILGYLYLIVLFKKICLNRLLQQLF